MADEPVRAEFLGSDVERTGVDVAYDEAWTAYQNNHYEEALGRLDALLSVVSDHERARFARALCYLKVDKPIRAEAELNRYIAAVHNKRVNTCDALFYRAMALNRLSWVQRALADLDVAISSKPGCVSGCACGMSCKAVEAVLARFAILIDPDVRREYEASGAAGGAPASAGGVDAPGRPSVDPAMFTYDAPTWVVPMHQLNDALDRAAARDRVPLLIDDSSDRALDQSFLYVSATIVEMKRYVIELRSGRVTLAAIHEDMRCKLVHAMRHGHTLVLRLGTSAADLVHRFCNDECFPINLLVGHNAVRRGDNLRGQQLERVLRAEDTNTGIFVVSDGFRVLVTSNLPPARVDELLAEALPLELMQPVHVVTETTVRDGRAGGVTVEELTAADRAKQPQLEGDRLSLFLQS